MINFKVSLHQPHSHRESDRPLKFKKCTLVNKVQLYNGKHKNSFFHVLCTP